METLKRCVTGWHTPREIRCHLALLGFGYWGLVAGAWLGYPAKNGFSLHREMLSALGSFEERCNPEWFWVFSIAMIYCGVFMMPVTFYIWRRFKAISARGAWLGAFFFVMGCIGMAWVGLFPYAKAELAGGWEWQHLHMLGAALLLLGFVPGVVWHGVLLLKDACTEKTFASREKAAYRKLAGPFLVCAPVIGLVAYQIRWSSVLAALQAAADASGEQMADNLMKAFPPVPILEHVAIWALTIFVIWFTVMLPSQATQGASRNRTDFQA
jgi:hypothetical protein